MTDHQVAKASSGEERAELKERMRNASFKLGLMQQAPKPQSMYTTVMSAPVKSEDSRNGLSNIKSEMRKTSIKITESKETFNITEAKQAFKSQPYSKNDPLTNLKAASINLKEVGNPSCFVTVNSTIFNSKGNPNQIRSVISD